MIRNYGQVYICAAVVAKTIQKRSLRPLVTGSAPRRTDSVQALRFSIPKCVSFPRQCAELSMLYWLLDPWPLLRYGWQLVVPGIHNINDLAWVGLKLRLVLQLIEAVPLLV